MIVIGTEATRTAAPSLKCKEEVAGVLNSSLFIEVMRADYSSLLVMIIGTEASRTATPALKCKEERYRKKSYYNSMGVTVYKNHEPLACVQ